MTEFLDENTSLVEDRQAGDILAMYLYGDLQHTAVFIDENTLWHKLGGTKSEYASEQKVKDSYAHDDIQILRIN